MKGYASFSKSSPGSFKITDTDGYPALQFYTEDVSDLKSGLLADIAKGRPYLRAYTLDADGNNLKDANNNNIYTNYLIPQSTHTSGVKNYNIITVNNIKDATNKIYPVGSIYTTSTNSNPSSYLGGTWTLVNKVFASYCSNDTSAFTINTTNTSEVSACYIYRGGQFVFIRLNIKNKVALTDGSTLEMGTFNFTKLGIDQASLTNYSNWSYCDALNGSMSYTVSNSTGALKNTDITDGSSTATGLSLYYNIFMPVTYSYMLDSVCSEFIWERTA